MTSEEYKALQARVDSKKPSKTTVTVKEFKKMTAPKEDSIYKQLATYLKSLSKPVIWRFDVGADIRLSIGQAKKIKALQGKKGYPDLFIAEPRLTFNGLFLEVKREGERLVKKNLEWATPHIAEQAEMHKQLRIRGYKAQFVRGFGEAKKVIDEYLGLTVLNNNKQ